MIKAMSNESNVLDARQRLPNRRGSTTLRVDYADMTGFRLKAYATYSRDPSGRIAEVFISAGKPGSSSEATLRDDGLLLSLAIQHGVPLKSIAAMMTRDDKGLPAGPMGVIVDRLIEEEQA